MKPARISAGGAPLTLDLNVTTRMIDRLKGWIGRKSIAERDALLIQPCNSIHTWFMSAPIDVVFLDRHRRVVGVRDNVGPRRLCMHWRAAAALELQAGRSAALGLAPGVQLDIDDGDTR
ncbi:DUF192 domain-containing protein [Paraburkholderia sp.]|uniref:DUF192 domain-containing protein n=1 Tax=Paraburkholderia sp. TaxID=1926495 RepID=UPI0039E3A1B0